MNLMKIWDISRTLTPELAPWPGDAGFSFDLNWKMAEGASVNVGALEMSVHNGTHADAIFHFEPNGETIERMPLDAYIGPAVVVDVPSSVMQMEVDYFAAFERNLAGAPRLLVKTNRWPDPTVFPTSIPVISSGLPVWLQGRGVKLLGVDLPSVDSIDAKHLANHHALAAAGIAIVESLDLSSVDPGVYNLAALPLKIAGGDGAPLRAVLWRD